MKNINLRLSFIGLLVSFLSLQMQSCKGKNKDTEIQSAIQAKTQSDAAFAGVNYAVAEGVVTLTGQTADETNKSNVENSVKGIDGVKSVVNNITVAPVTITQDNPLQAGAERIAAKYGNVQAETSDGVITLRGQIQRDSLQQLMIEMNELKPKSIENQLVIK